MSALGMEMQAAVLLEALQYEAERVADPSVKTPESTFSSASYSDQKNQPS